MAQIKKFGVLQTAKFASVMYLIITAIFLIPFALIMMLSGIVVQERTGIMTFFGGAFMFLLPIIYAFIGFIFVAIFCLLYNLVASLIGGIEIEIE